MQQVFDLLEFQVGDESILRTIWDCPVEEPFTDERIAFLDAVSKRLLSDKEAKQYPDVITFAFWIRKANMEYKKKKYINDSRFRLGRGAVFHVAPSNVAVNYAYSFAAGFILGNASIVRLPSKKFIQIDIINRAIHSVLNSDGGLPEGLKKTMVFLRYGREKIVNDYLSSLCDVRVVWGGDSTIQELRKSELGPRAVEITFADRYSFCVIEAEAYLQAEDKDKIARDFYNDTYYTDQNACNSPRLICWSGSIGSIEKAQGIFWEKLHAVILEKYEFQPVQYVDKLTEVCLAAAYMDGIHMIEMEDNTITRIRLESLQEKIKDIRGHSGFFYEYHMKDVMELAYLCDKRVQTIAYIGDKEKIMPLIRSGIKGIDRVVDVGKTMEFDLVWDGYNLVEWMTRMVGGFDLVN